jgi:hypothetical protein
MVTVGRIASQSPKVIREPGYPISTRVFLHFPGRRPNQKRHFKLSMFRMYDLPIQYNIRKKEQKTYLITAVDDGKAEGNVADYRRRK